MKNTSIYILAIFVFFSCSKEKQPVHMQSFDIADVKITDGQFLKAQQSGLNYILELDMDRLLAPFLREAGIKPLKESYGNWENSGLDGHIGGHYLSALSFMYAATGKQELLDRVNYMINWLDTCQQKNENGYVGGIPDGKTMWEEIAKGEIEAGSFSLNKKWVPLYNIHKLYAGLRDVYLNTGNKKALDILVSLTDWCIETTKNLSDEQLQEILRSEHGGLNEVFVDVAELTGDDKYLELARRFSHKAILNPLLQNKNELTGLHANTQIPKIIGYKRYADATNNKEWADATALFWDLVIDKWTVSIGGNSVREHFHPVDDFSSMINSNQGPETCNTYNMLRLTKLLFMTNPQAKYIEYYERALYNHILSSIHPEKGGFVYFTPMRPQHYRVYSQSQQCFWCCVGSGLENPGKYTEMIYSHTAEDLYVNLFIPSELNWKSKGVKIRQITNFPYSETSEIKIELTQEKEFSIFIRKPKWVVDKGFEVAINGEKQDLDDANDLYYIELHRKWKDGDLIAIKIPAKNRVEKLPDQSNWVSFIHGPIVLAAVSDSTKLDGLWADDSRMGHVASGEFYPIDEAPMLVTDSTNIQSYLKADPEKSLSFTISDLIHQKHYKNLKLVPFFSIHEARYIIYWPLYNTKELNSKLEEMKKAEEEFLALEALTIDQVAPGEQQPESDHNFKGEQTNSGTNKNKYWRDAKGWFSYDLRDKNKEASTLRITYFGQDGDREFTISLNDFVLDTVKLDGSKGDAFYDVDYKIPEQVFNKNYRGKLNLKFSAINEKTAGGIYYIRLLRE